MSAKPYSDACDQNKEPILAVLTEVLPSSGELLEIGSGTGQHAAYFPRYLPNLTWLPSDVAEHLPGIRAWCDDAGLANVRAPVELEVCQPDWPVKQVDAVFSANTAHIMSWPQVQCMFAGVGRILRPDGCFCLYGPFKYEGRHTSASNERFDGWLRARDPLSGVREFEALIQLAADAGMTLREDYAMPVNNRILVWRRD